MVKEAPKDEEAAEENKPAPASGPPRKTVIALAVFALLVLLALSGVITALLSHSEDPESIKIPERMAAAPAAEETAAQAADDLVLPQEEPVTIDATASPPEGAAQTESQIDLNAPKPEKKPVLLKPQEKSAPQSMIQWNRLPRLAMDKAPKIVIVIDDMGLNRRNAARMAAIEAPLTLSYMAYADDLPRQTAQAAANGHELIVHVPMEPKDRAHNNPGPSVLSVDLSPAENVARLSHDLEQFEGYIGLNNHMGSAMTASRTAMRPVMEEIKRRGLWFLDSRTTAASVADDLAAEMGVPYAVRDVFLDNVESVAAILKQLRQTEMVAQQRGYAVAIGHPYDATIAALQQWLPQARASGFEIVPLSTVISQRFPDASVPRYARTKDRTSLSENRVRSGTDGAM